MFAKFISTCLIFSSFILVFASFSLETFATIQCTENLKKELESQIERYQTLANLPSQAENKAKIQKGLSNNKNKTSNLPTEIENKIKNLAQAQIQIEFEKLNLPKTTIESGLSIENIIEKDGKIVGIVIERRIYNYADGDFGSGSNKYDFVLDLQSGNLTLAKYPEFINATEKTAEPDILESKKQEILKQKEINTQNNRGISKEEQIKELKKDKKSEYQNKLEQAKKDLINANCKGVKVRAAGTYSGYNTARYASYYAYSKPSNFNYYDGADCTNFASQSVFNGGLNFDFGYYFLDSSWYSGKNINGQFDSISVSKSWRSVESFMNHMYWNENTGSWLEFDNSGYSIFDPLQTGDLLFADWYRDGIWDHSMIITGWDYIGGHWEPRLSYHTTDAADKSFADVKSGYSNPKFRGLHILTPVW